MLTISFLKKKLNQKGCKVNSLVKELRKEKNIYSKRIKRQYLNKGKLHLINGGSKILSNNFIGVISKVFNWQSEGGNPNAVPGECIFNKMLSLIIYSDCNKTMNIICSDNTNKLIFAQLNMNYKFEIPAEQVKGKIDILMVLETEVDESFPQENFLIGGFSPPC